MNLGNLSLLSRIESNTNYMYYYASVKDIPQAAVIWCVGASIFFIGYLFFEKKSFPVVGMKFEPKDVDKIFYIILTLVLFSGVIFPYISFLGNIAKVLGLLADIGILFFARLWAAEKNKKYMIYVFILFVLQTYNALMHSYLRLEIITPTIVLFAGYFAGKRDVKFLFSYRILPFVLIIGFFISIFSILGKYRASFGNVVQEEIFNSNSNDEDPEQEDVYSNEGIDRGGFLDRSATLGQISAMIKLVEKKGFYNGQASLPLAAALVPRVLWPDKPKVAIGQWFAIETGTAYVREGSTNANNSINLTIPGEFYMDFGWVGLAIGCFLFGGLIVSFWNSAQFYVSNYNLFGAIWGGYILYIGITGISGDLQIVVTYISFYLVFLVLKKFICAYYV